jgi:hypothetical protein
VGGAGQNDEGRCDGLTGSLILWKGKERQEVGCGLINNQLDIAIPGTSGQAAETGSIESRRGLGPVDSTVGVARYLSVRTGDE